MRQEEKEKVHRNNLKNREFSKEGPQNLHSERGTIAERQGPSENANSEVNPTQLKTDSSSYFGVPKEDAKPRPPKKYASLLRKKNLKKAFILSEIFRKLGD